MGDVEATASIFDQRGARWARRALQRHSASHHLPCFAEPPLSQVSGRLDARKPCALSVNRSATSRSR